MKTAAAPDRRRSDALVLDVLYLAGRARARRRHRPDRPSGGEAVIVFDLVAAVLAVAAIAYCVVALVRPERF